MIYGRLVRLQLLWKLIPNRRLCANLLRFLSCGSRGHSSKSDLFTLDIDLESDADPQKPDTEKKVANDHRKAENDSKIRAALFTEKGEFSGKTTEDTDDLSKDDNAKDGDTDYLDSLLADIVVDAPIENQENDFEIDSVFGDLFKEKTGSSQDELMLDSDITSFDHDGSRQCQNKNNTKQKTFDGHVLADEKELFEKIFATYSQPEEEYGSSDKLHRLVLLNLQESFLTVNRAAEAAPEQYAIESFSVKESHAIEKNTKEALAKTLDYIKDIPTKETLVGFARDLFQRFQNTEFSKKLFYLHKLKGESSAEYLKRHAELTAETQKQSETTPETPVLNVFTMPIIFNHIVSVLCTHHHDGALALTLFNLAKEDLNFYTNVCNQRTYNEMLKVHWVFFGKRSLCEVELIVVEMMNNGFAGDAHTFAILKEILTTHYAMKLGQSAFNPGGMSIWSKEDEKRAKNLTSKLKVLGKELQKERFFRNGYQNVRRR